MDTNGRCAVCNVGLCSDMTDGLCDRHNPKNDPWVDATNGFRVHMLETGEMIESTSLLHALNRAVEGGYKRVRITRVNVPVYTGNATDLDFRTLRVITRKGR